MCLAQSFCPGKVASEIQTPGAVNTGSVAEGGAIDGVDDLGLVTENDSAQPNRMYLNLAN